MSTWIANRLRKARKKRKKFDAKYVTPRERWLNRRLYGDKARCGGCGRYFSTELEGWRWNATSGKIRCMKCVELADGDNQFLWASVR